MTTNLSAGMTGKSIEDGKPFKVADNDAWVRSSNKNYKRKIARQYLNRMGGHPVFDRKTLTEMATREQRVAR